MAEVDALCRAAACGDEENAHLLVNEGADANARSTDGTSVIAALLLGAFRLEEIDAIVARASAPARLSILSFLLYRRAFTLRSLNAPDISLNGLTPLCMAAYLGRLDFVSALLEKGDGLVLVDGTDTQRATPAMYAARDGHKDVLQYLIRQGARADFGDCHHRSVSFYAISHPQCLWSCEASLRLRRAESLLSHKKRKLKLALQRNASSYVSHAARYQDNPAPWLQQTELNASTRLLINAISASDHLTVHSLLFPSFDSDEHVPILVNFQDERGRSPIHYCVSAQQPNARILDALYLAGADLTLYSADSDSDGACSSLHILAREGGYGNCTSFRLYAFVVHLVRDLGAPLNAVDAQGNTCLHIAARHGSCLDILMALLECDHDGAVRKMRNDEGHTAEEVAKAEFLSAFEPDDGSRRPDSAASMRTIKATFSNSSLVSGYSSTSSDSSSSEEEDDLCDQYPPPVSHDKETLRAALSQTKEIDKFLGVLEALSQETAELDALARYPEANTSRLSVDDVEDRLQLCRQDASVLLENTRLLVDAEFTDLEAMKEVYDSVRELITRLEGELQENTLTVKSKSNPINTFHNRQPSLHLRTSYSTLRSGATTPSLVASGSSSSHSSFASFADVATPADSPQFDRHDSALGLLSQKSDEMASEYFKGAKDEIDFACALAAGSVTRTRRASCAQSLAAEVYTTAPQSQSPLEPGTDLISIPPEGAPHGHGSLSLGMSTGAGRASRRESWIGPIVRQTNARTFQAHLENLLEIEKVLFGAEDAEREDGPRPGLGPDEEVQGSWREGIEALQEVLQDVDADRDEEAGNFLEMAEGDASSASEVDIGDLTAAPTSTQDPPEVIMTFTGSCSASDIIYIAHKEALSLAEAILNGEQTLSSAEQYLSRAERLVNRIFQDKEHVVQAARLSLALSDLCQVEDDIEDERFSAMRSPDYICLAPASSPSDVRIRRAGGDRSPLATPTGHVYESEAKALLSPASPISGTSSPGTISGSDDLRALRRLLMRKIPGGLSRAADEIDSTAVWLGVVQGVVRTVKRTRV